MDEVNWMALEDLPDGSLFETQGGTLAVVSEYRNGNKMWSQRLCILLSSGEFGHFENRDKELVRPVELSSLRAQLAAAEANLANMTHICNLRMLLLMGAEDERDRLTGELETARGHLEKIANIIDLHSDPADAANVCMAMAREYLQPSQPEPDDEPVAGTG